jgi:hypothetical protein
MLEQNVCDWPPAGAAVISLIVTETAFLEVLVHPETGLTDSA